MLPRKSRKVRRLESVFRESVKDEDAIYRYNGRRRRWIYRDGMVRIFESMGLVRGEERSQCANVAE